MLERMADDVEEIVRRKMKELYTLAVARTDMRAALAACEMLLLLPDEEWGADPYWALHQAVVVAYGRPFSDNKPQGKLPARYSRFDDSRGRELHKMLIEERNTAVAHSDLEHKQVLIYAPGTLHPGTGKPFTAYGTSVRRWGIDRAAFTEIRELIHEVGATIDLDVQQLVMELYEGAKLPPGGFELTYEKAPRVLARRAGGVKLEVSDSE